MKTRPFQNIPDVESSKLNRKMASESEGNNLALFFLRYLCCGLKRWSTHCENKIKRSHLIFNSIFEFVKRYAMFFMPNYCVMALFRMHKTKSYQNAIPIGGGSRISQRRGGANLLFGQFSPKTAWKWRNFGPGGARGTRAPPLRSATADTCILWSLCISVHFLESLDRFFFLI